MRRSSSWMLRASSTARVRVDIRRQRLDAHSQPCQWRAQFVRRICQQRFVGNEQRLDALGRAIECLGEARDLVAALDLHPGRQVAGTERGDAVLQFLEPARQAANHRIGANADHQRDRAKRAKPGEAAQLSALGAWPCRHQPTPVVELHCLRPVRTAPPARPASPFRGERGGDRPVAGVGDHAAVAIEQRELIAAELAPAFERRALHCERRGCRRSQLRNRRRIELRARAEAIEVAKQPPAGSGQHGEQNKAAEHRQIDAEVQPRHQSCAFANTYPAPRTVMMRLGCLTSSSIAVRMRPMWTSIERSRAGS